MGPKRLQRLAREKKIVGFPDPTNIRGDWIFDRQSLDAFREGQFVPAQPDESRKKFLEIFGDAF